METRERSAGEFITSYNEKLKLFHDNFVTFSIDEIKRYKKDGTALGGNFLDAPAPLAIAIPLMASIATVRSFLNHNRQNNLREKVNKLFAKIADEQQIFILSSAIREIAVDLETLIEDTPHVEIPNLAALATLKLFKFIETSDGIEQLNENMVVEAIFRRKTWTLDFFESDVFLNRLEGGNRKYYRVIQEEEFEKILVEYKLSLNTDDTSLLSSFIKEKYLDIKEKHKHVLLHIDVSTDKKKMFDYRILNGRDFNTDIKIIRIGLIEKTIQQAKQEINEIKTTSESASSSSRIAETKATAACEIAENADMQARIALNEAKAAKEIAQERPNIGNINVRGDYYAAPVVQHREKKFVYKFQINGVDAMPLYRTIVMNEYHRTNTQSRSFNQNLIENSTEEKNDKHYNLEDSISNYARIAQGANDLPSNLEPSLSSELISHEDSISKSFNSKPLSSQRALTIGSESFSSTYVGRDFYSGDVAIHSPGDVHVNILSPNKPEERSPHDRLEITQDISNNFVGRDDKLDQAHQYFLEHDGAVQVVGGVCGVGKTEFVRQYVKKYGQEYSEVWRFPADNEESLRSSFKRLARKPNNYEDKNDEEIIKSIKQNLAENVKKSLLILDNAKSLKIVEKYLPYNDGENKHHVFITTRNVKDYKDNSRSLTANIIKLEPLDPDDAVKYIQNEIPTASRDEALELARLFNNILGGIEQNIDYIKEADGISIRDYLDVHLQLKEEHLIRLQQMYPQALHQDFFISLPTILGALHSEPRALEMLKLFSYLHSDNNPDDLFDGLFENQMQKNKIISALEGYSFISTIRIKDETGKMVTYVSIPKIIQDVMSFFADVETLHKVAGIVSGQIKPQNDRELMPLNKRDIIEEDDMQLLSIRQSMQAHVISIVKHYEQTGDRSNSLAKAKLYTVCGNLCFSRGNLDEALTNYNKAKLIIDEITPENTTLLEEDKADKKRININILQGSGTVYERLSRYGEALESYEAALSAKKEFYGTRAPIKIARTEYSIGCVQFRLAHYDEAIEQLKKSLNTITFENRGTKTVISGDIIDSIDDTNKKDAFVKLVKDAPLEVKSLVANILDVAGNICMARKSLSIYNNLPTSQEYDSGIYNRLPKIAAFTFTNIFNNLKPKSPGNNKDLLFYETALEINSATYQTNHPKTVLSRHHIAEAQLLSNNFKQAMAGFNLVSTSYRNHYGENADHIDMALIAQSTGRAHMAQGNYKNAEEMFKTSLNVIDNYGNQYREHKATIHNLLGTLYAKTARNGGAVKNFKEVLNIRNEIFTSDHPHIKQANFDLYRTEAAMALMISFIVKETLESAPQLRYLSKEYSLSYLEACFKFFDNHKASVQVRYFIKADFLANIDDKTIDNIALGVFHLTASAIGIYAINVRYACDIHLVSASFYSLPYTTKLFANDLYFYNKQLLENKNSKPITNLSEFYEQCYDSMSLEFDFSAINFVLGIFTMGPIYWQLMLGEVGMRTATEGIHCYNINKPQKIYHAENHNKAYENIYKNIPSIASSFVLGYITYNMGVNLPTINIFDPKNIETNMIFVKQVTISLNAITFTSYFSKTLLDEFKEQITDTLDYSVQLILGESNSNTDL